MWLSRLGIREQRGVPAILERAERCAELGRLGDATKILAGAADSDAAEWPYVQTALASISIRGGRLGDAMFRLTRLLENPNALSSSLRHTCEQLRAYTFAVAGAHDVAEDQCSAASWLRYPMTPLRYIVLCRRRKFAELPAPVGRHAVGARLGRGGPALADPGLGRHGERVICLLSAFALHQDVKESEASSRRRAELLGAARAAYSTEYDYLQANWPELRSFVTYFAPMLEVRLRLFRSVRIPPWRALGRRQGRDARAMVHRTDSSKIPKSFA